MFNAGGVQTDAEFLIQRYFDAHLPQQREHGRYVAQVRQILHSQCFRDQDGSTQDRQGRILGARHSYFTGERNAPLNNQLVHSGVCRLLFGPLLRRECTHRQGVDFLPHAVAKRPINNLMLLDAILVAKLRTDDNGFEMLAVANHFNVIASEAFLDIRLDGLGGKHVFGNDVASGAQLVATSNQQQSRE